MSKAWINPQNKHKFDNNICVLCTAGANYFVVKRNGQIQRCFHDLTSMGDMLEYPKCMNKVATKCNVGYICDASGDQMFSTQWGFEKTKKNDYYKDNPVCTSWIDKDPNKLSNNHAYVIVYPTEGCNFRCPYCCNYYPADEEDSRPFAPGERNTEDWCNFFDLLAKNTKNVQMNFNGGEPLLRKDIHLLMKKTLELNFKCSMVTNFSVFKRLDQIFDTLIQLKNYKTFKFSITLHPNSFNKKYDFDKTLEYIKKYHEHGFVLRIIMLGWPEHLPCYEKYSQIFKEMNIPFWLKWVGGYDDKLDQKTIDFIYHHGGCKSTAEYLQEINWEGIDKTRPFKKI